MCAAKRAGQPKEQEESQHDSIIVECVIEQALEQKPHYCACKHHRHEPVSRICTAAQECGLSPKEAGNDANENNKPYYPKLQEDL